MRDVEHILRFTTHNAFMVVHPIGEGVSESTVIISNVPQAYLQETSALDKGMTYNKPVEYDMRSRIQQRIISYMASVKEVQGGVRLVNNVSGTSAKLYYSDDIVCPQLRFLGIILRSQLVTLLKYKAYDKQASIYIVTLRVD